VRPSTHAFVAVFVLAMAALTSAAQFMSPKFGSAPVAKQALPEVTRAPAGLKVILLKPSILLEDAPVKQKNSYGDFPSIPGKSRTVQRRAPAGASEYERVLLNAASREVESKASLLDVDTLKPPAVEACKRLELLTSQLARGDLNDEAINDIASLAAVDDHYAILVQFFHLETIPANTTIQAALVSSSTRRVVWKGSRVVHKALKPTDGKLDKELTELYRSFDIK
jgi:hypothetical protein